MEWVPASREILGECGKDSCPYYLLNFVLERLLVGNPDLLPTMWVRVTPS